MATEGLVTTKTELLEFASWKALPTTTKTKSGFPSWKDLRGSSQPDSRDSRPGKTFRPLPKTAFPGFPSWKALRGGSQDQFPQDSRPARPSGNHPGPNCRDSVLDTDPKPIKVLFLESDLQNMGTAIAIRRD